MRGRISGGRWDWDRLERRRIHDARGARAPGARDVRQHDQGKGGGERRDREQSARSHDPRTIRQFGLATHPSLPLMRAARGLSERAGSPPRRSRPANPSFVQARTFTCFALFELPAGPPTRGGRLRWRIRQRRLVLELRVCEVDRAAERVDDVEAQGSDPRVFRVGHPDGEPCPSRPSARPNRRADPRRSRTRRVRRTGRRRGAVRARALSEASVPALHRPMTRPPPDGPPADTSSRRLERAGPVDRGASSGVDDRAPGETGLRK